MRPHVRDEAGALLEQRGFVHAERLVLLRRLNLQHQVRALPSGLGILRNTGARFLELRIRNAGQFASPRLDHGRQRVFDIALHGLGSRGYALFADSGLFSDKKPCTHTHGAPCINAVIMPTPLNSAAEDPAIQVMTA